MASSDLIEVNHKLHLQLLEGVHTHWLESEIPCSDHFMKNGWESKVESGVKGFLNYHESLVALQVSNTFIGLLLGHLEMSEN